MMTGPTSSDRMHIRPWPVLNRFKVQYCARGRLKPGSRLTPAVDYVDLLHVHSGFRDYSLICGMEDVIVNWPVMILSNLCSQSGSRVTLAKTHGAYSPGE